MSAKVVFDFIKNSFEKENYTLLTKDYKNNKQKLKFICHNRHNHEITWTKWQQGVRCRYCFGTFTTEAMRESFEKEDYILLTEKYPGSHGRIDYICPKGHRHHITWNNWRSGYRCAYCGGNGKPSIDYIRSEFSKEGYVLLSDVYIDSDTKLDFSCPSGHQHSIRWRNWKYGARCYSCQIEKRSGEGCHLWKDDSIYNLSEFSNYKGRVTSITNYNFRKYSYLIDPENIGRGNGYDLDHCVSISDGFKNNIDPEIIASPVNLKVVTVTENRSKNSNSSMAIDVLCNAYQVWKNLDPKRWLDVVES